MTPRHFDLRANEAKLRTAEFNEFSAAILEAKDKETKQLVLAQNRMRDSAILPQLEVMRALNDGAETDIVIGAVAVNTAIALLGMADLTDRSTKDVVERFAAMLLDTIDVLDSLDEDELDDPGPPEGSFYAQGGNA